MLEYGLTFVLGVCFASGVYLILGAKKTSKLDLIMENTALTISIGHALSIMDEDKREEWQENVNEDLKEAFGEHASVNLEEVRR